MLNCVVLCSSLYVYCAMFEWGGLLILNYWIEMIFNFLNFKIFLYGIFRFHLWFSLLLLIYYLWIFTTTRLVLFPLALSLASTTLTLSRSPPTFSTFLSCFLASSTQSDNLAAHLMALILYCWGHHCNWKKLKPLQLGKRKMILVNNDVSNRTKFSS